MGPTYHVSPYSLLLIPYSFLQAEQLGGLEGAE